MVSNPSLVVPSDEDSDAAVSFSDGRRTPLPPIEGDSEPGETDMNGDDDDSEIDDSIPSGHGEAQAEFFTPEPPSTPAQEAAVDKEDSDEDEDEDEDGDKAGNATERVPSPPVEAVGA